MSGNLPERGTTYPATGTVELDLEQYGMNWDQFWDAESHTFAPDSARNMHLLFVRALVAGTIPAQFALRFGKEVYTHVLPRKDDKPKEICGLAKHFLGCKLIKGGGNRRSIPAKHPILSAYEFAAIGCCSIQFPQLEAEEVQDDAPPAIVDEFQPRLAYRAGCACMQNAETQTDFNYEQMASWMQSMLTQQQQAQQQQMQQAQMQSPDNNQPQQQSPKAAAEATYKAMAEAANQAIAEVATEATDPGSPGYLSLKLQALKENKAASICGAPVIIGRVPGGRTMRCQFLGSCQHGVGASCGYMHAVVRDELVRLVKQRTGAANLTSTQLWLELQQFITDMAQGDANTGAAMQRLVASRTMVQKSLGQAKKREERHEEAQMQVLQNELALDDGDGGDGGEQPDDAEPLQHWQERGPPPEQQQQLQQQQYQAVHPLQQQQQQDYLLHLPQQVQLHGSGQFQQLLLQQGGLEEEQQQEQQQPGQLQLLLQGGMDDEVEEGMGVQQDQPDQDLQLDSEQEEQLGQQLEQQLEQQQLYLQQQLQAGQLVQQLQSEQQQEEEEEDEEEDQVALQGQPLYMQQQLRQQGQLEQLQQHGQQQYLEAMFALQQQQLQQLQMQPFMQPLIYMPAPAAAPANKRRRHVM